MSRRVTRTEVLRLVGGDEDLLRLLASAGLLPRRTPYCMEDLEAARLAHTLVHELDVNVAGVEIIMRMRQELLETRQQVAELLELLREQGMAI